MKNTVVSLMDEMKSSAGHFLGPVTGLTFRSTMDFTPHAENYLGELPMLFAFGEDYKKQTGWTEIKDGYFSLLPFLLKNPMKVVLPEIAGLFMEEFYSASISYAKKNIQHDLCYVHMDFYQELSSVEHLNESFEKLLSLAKRYEKVKVCFATHALSSRKPNMSHLFYQHLRSLPQNCEIISNSDLFDQSDFKGRGVYLFTDTDFVLKSPWENIFAARGGIINNEFREVTKEVVMRVPLSEKAEKVVIKNKGLAPLSQDLRDHLTNLTEMIQSDQDLLNPSYLRQMREAVKLLKTSHHVA